MAHKSGLRKLAVAAGRVRGFVQGNARRQFDITPAGKQFLMMFP